MKEERLLGCFFSFWLFSKVCNTIDGVKKTNPGPESSMNEQIHGRGLGPHVTISVRSTTAGDTNADGFFTEGCTFYKTAYPHLLSNNGGIYEQLFGESCCAGGGRGGWGSTWHHTPDVYSGCPEVNN